jgi:hypothetical protein
LAISGNVIRFNIDKINIVSIIILESLPQIKDLEMPRIAHSLFLSNGIGRFKAFCLMTDLSAPLPVGSRICLEDTVVEAGGENLCSLEVKEIRQDFSEHPPAYYSTRNHLPGDIYMILERKDDVLSSMVVKNYPKVARCLRKQGWYE